MYISSLDLGTTGCRTYIFDLAGTILASDYQEWESHYPQPSFVEQDANSWWESIKKTTEGAIKKSGIDKSEIVSLLQSSLKEYSALKIRKAEYSDISNQIESLKNNLRRGIDCPKGLSPIGIVMRGVCISRSDSSLRMRWPSSSPPLRCIIR